MQASQTMREPLTASGPPLDYSFKELRSCAELETEEPRSGSRRIPDAKADGEGADGETGGEEGVAGAGNTAASAVGRAGATGGLGGTGGPGAAAQTAMVSGTQKKLCVIRKLTTAVKLNNNLLETAQGLPEALSLCMANPMVALQWLDLSFNQLVTVEDSLLKFQNLKALYLHGNCLKSLQACERLKKLPKLLILTLNGNPIESSKIYRPYIIGALPNLRALDHSTVTEDETASAISWFKGHSRRKKERDERLKDMALAND
eukprot:TRINITY_DN6640_c0_g1_i1.p1 TRINITY_DN6640_c0_g1~~TRINITY_DN6640_c0_g1_i1.p1  ORF type:complete len:261 (+),score=53.00 TRINITY_DN6640_c0_g1_i1:73-855(+)